MSIRGFLLFDIDGVIRDVTRSYRLAIQKTVLYFCKWEPSIENIDILKEDGSFNNDWDLSFHLINRYFKKHHTVSNLPSRNQLIQKFNEYYFGGEINDSSNKWEGFIRNESLLVDKKFFNELTNLRIKWGFVSGSERASATFILCEKLKLENPPLIAMGEAPDKPNPNGFLRLLKYLSSDQISSINSPIAYVGDTVADVLTLNNARNLLPNKKLISFAVAPPHLHLKERLALREKYERNLLLSGADIILKSTSSLIDVVKQW